MTKEQELQLLKVRLNTLKARGRYEDCPGVYNKLKRKIQKLEEELDN